MAAPWIDWRLASEIEPFPRAVLQQRFGYKLPEDHNQGDALLWGDMTEVTPELARKHGVPLPDILVAGTPCQAFSIAGLRNGTKDARGNLTLKFVETCHAIVDARPDGRLIVVWENVPGVLSDKGNAFGCFLAGLSGADDALLPPDREWGWHHKSEWAREKDSGGEKIAIEKATVGGAWGWKRISWNRAGMVAGPRARIAWRVLDAQHFGVPQRRARVFLVADFGNAIDPAAVLFERKGSGGNIAPGGGARKDVAPTLAARTKGGGGLGTDFEVDGGLIPEIAQALPKTVGALTDGAHNGGGLNGQDAYTGRIIPWAECVTGDKTHTITAEGHDASEDCTGRGTPVVAYDLRGREGGAQFEGPHNTANIRAASGGSSRSYVFDPNQITSKANRSVPKPELCHTMPGTTTPPMLFEPTVRRLTPTECHRLQGFPDDHCAITYRGKPAADGPQYKALGNSMAVPVMRWILERITPLQTQQNVGKV